ncbi:small subunit ribosomal protein S5 [Mycoplasmoides fastidiosum]|uniref:Small ribosomal subunit protein uS5 n=1 Tax=Mycoplasmoides fastidiosum TaxID=92758 RepID=A0ABU0LY62_9BACT|nr:small subunit ribosomal protein S5 [Mycoplasmoides fastidiosum]UUD37960.1 30S ribosomal protein S5 [Mycoplasmoides fastidiosum]
MNTDNLKPSNPTPEQTESHQTDSQSVVKSNPADAKAAAVAAVTKSIGDAIKPAPRSSNSRPGTGSEARKPRNPDNRRNSDRKLGGATFKPKQEFEEKLVAWKRVSKTTKGGRQGRIWTLVVVGNKKGSIGYGIGKAEEFPDAMKKAVKNALKNVVKVKINANGTVYHENIGKHCASRVLIKPAKIGIGIIAGGPIKTVLELAGYTDIYSKNLGSSSSMNMVQATIKALLKQHTPAEIAKLRDKRIEEL